MEHLVVLEAVLWVGLLYAVFISIFPGLVLVKKSEGLL